MSSDVSPDLVTREGMADERKSAALAKRSVSGSGKATIVRDFATARAILRSGAVVQAGAGADGVDKSRPEDISLFYLDGDPHRKRRAAISKFFTLRAIETRYRPIMERTADALLSRFVANGVGALDQIAFRFAVAIASDVIGLDHGDLEGLSSRLDAVISGGDGKSPIKAADDDALHRFYELDVEPAIEQRRVSRRDDVISQLLEDGASDRFIRTEVRGYALAGMITTREFIVMAAWYLLERPGLCTRFRKGDEEEQFAILSEILRLEPVVGFLARQTTSDLDLAACNHMLAGSVVAIDIRGANTDPTMAGSCPYLFDTERAGPIASNGGLSFGDGHHRCPGAQLALHEARVFLDRLCRIPGIRMESEPRMSWFKPITGYELHEAMIGCSRAG